MDLAIQNTISAVVLHDVVYDPGERNMPICLRRLDPHNDLILPDTRRDGYDPMSLLPEPPTRPPTSLPPPRDVTLHTSIAQYLGSGRTGLVYTLSNASLSDPHTTLPDVVFKIARPHRCADLYRESWFYAEMECLQGVAVPRCYGLFEADIPDGCAVRLPDKLRFLETKESESPDANIDQIPDPRILDLRSTRNKLFILVLERLGGRLPIEKPISTELREDLYTLFEEIGYLGIRNARDVRYANILEAPPSPPGLPSLESPYTSRTHGWRIIDFEMAEKNIQTVSALKWQHLSYLELILDGLEEGYIWERPW